MIPVGDVQLLPSQRQISLQFTFRIEDGLHPDHTETAITHTPLQDLAEFADALVLCDACQ